MTNRHNLDAVARWFYELIFSPGLCHIQTLIGRDPEMLLCIENLLAGNFFGSSVYCLQAYERIKCRRVVSVQRFGLHKVSGYQFSWSERVHISL